MDFTNTSVVISASVWLAAVIGTFLVQKAPKLKVNDIKALTTSPAEQPKPKPGESRCYSDHLHSAYNSAVNEPEADEWNPFVNDTKYLTTMQRLKVAVMSWTIFPIRLILSIVFLLLFVSFGNLAAIGLGSEAGLTKPISSFRRALLFPARLLLRAILFAWGFHWVTVKGKKGDVKR